MIKAVNKFLSSHTKYSICGMSGLWISCEWLKFKILLSVILQLVALQGPGVTRGNYREGNNLEKKLMTQITAEKWNLVPTYSTCFSLQAKK